MRRFRLTPAAKILCVVLVLGILGGVGAFAYKSGWIQNDLKDKHNNVAVNTVNEKPSVVVNNTKPDSKPTNTKTDNNNVINLSLDEWIGWKSVIDANGGLTTQPGSIYDKLGIKVNINIINSATQSSNALINGDLDAAGYTINRTAFLSNKFKTANFDVVMPYITNFSNGGDGIIANSGIKSVKDFIGANIGVPQFSEAHTLVVWLVNQSDLTQDEKNDIINNLVFFETPDDAAKAFFAGKIDAAATWEPYLTQAKNMSDAHVLFSTASSSSLVMDGILFNKDFAENNRDIVTKFIDGSLQAADMYKTEFKAIKQVMPMFSVASDQDIVDSCVGAKLMTYADNVDVLSGTARTIYSNMCNVWESIGENVNDNLVDTLFDDSYITALSGKYNIMDVTKADMPIVVSDDNKQEILEIESLLKKSASVNFIINTAKFSDPAEATEILDEFIDMAKVLNGTIIEIAGNTDPNPTSDPNDTYNKMLSQQRAETVKQYFVLNGIDTNRIVVVGNGSSNPMVPNDSEGNRALNRRTDVSFKCIEVG